MVTNLFSSFYQKLHQGARSCLIVGQTTWPPSPFWLAAILPMLLKWKCQGMYLPGLLGKEENTVSDNKIGTNPHNYLLFNYDDSWKVNAVQYMEFSPWKCLLYNNLLGQYLHYSLLISVRDCWGCILTYLEGSMTICLRQLTAASSPWNKNYTNIKEKVE